MRSDAIEHTYLFLDPGEISKLIGQGTTIQIVCKRQPWNFVLGQEGATVMTQIKVLCQTSRGINMNTKLVHHQTINDVITECETQ
jgi:hypothetical protein